MAPLDEDPSRDLLLQPAKYHANDYGSVSSSDLEAPTQQQPVLDRSIENEVLEETAVTGRNLGWSSAYILIMSRVIGSGIFATPGVIVQSVGSVGLSLVLWYVCLKST